jgi:tetratricopeptide (TPR) repeat protein
MARILPHIIVSRLTVPITAAVASFLLLSSAAADDATHQTPQAANFQNTRLPLDWGFIGRLFRADPEPAAPRESRPKSDVIPVRPSGSLIAGLRAGVPPRRAAALRLEEKGRRLLLGGAYQRSLIYFEKALGIEADPYVYFYLAKAHYHLAHVQDSLRFLEVAANLLYDREDWMAEIDALRVNLRIAAREVQHNVRPVAMPLR